MAIRVNAAVKAVQPTVSYPFGNTVVAKPCLGQLRTREHPPLPPGKLPQAGLGVFPFHFAMESAPPRKFAPPAAPERGWVGTE